MNGFVAPPPSKCTSHQRIVASASRTLLSCQGEEVETTNPRRARSLPPQVDSQGKGCAGRSPTRRNSALPLGRHRKEAPESVSISPRRRSPKKGHLNSLAAMDLSSWRSTPPTTPSGGFGNDVGFCRSLPVKPLASSVFLCLLWLCFLPCHNVASCCHFADSGVRGHCAS